MKKMINALLLIFTIAVIYCFRDQIYLFYDQYFVPIEKKVSKLENNSYHRDYDFNYVQNTTNFIPHNKDDIKNIYYTIVNSGMEIFTFYCPRDYETCINDVNDIANNQSAISNINNFVSPYNTFRYLETEVNTTGKITVKTEKVYNDEMIILINYKIDEITKKLVKKDDDDTTKIKKIHDYIINNTKYDKERSDKKIVNYKSDNAYGVLIENYGLCGGYTDAMMLFLERLNIKNIKVATENHIWNYVYLNDKWLHLDLTWDDPISDDGKNILDDTYFLITDKELKQTEPTEHNYDVNIYKN